MSCNVIQLSSCILYSSFQGWTISRKSFHDCGWQAFDELVLLTPSTGGERDLALRMITMMITLSVLQSDHRLGILASIAYSVMS